jgi:hypothetical protein
MITHWVLIVFLYLNPDTIASSRPKVSPIEYGAIFSTRELCERFAESSLLSIADVQRFVCLPRPGYKAK